MIQLRRLLGLCLITAEAITVVNGQGDDTDDVDAPFTIETCEDVLGWFGTRRVDPTRFFTGFFDCTCTGSFLSKFSMSCQYKSDRCFQPYLPLSGIEQQGTGETFCVYRTYDIEFYVDPEKESHARYIPNGETVCYQYVDGPGVGNEICIQAANSCSLQLKDIHGESTEGAVSICNDLDICRSTLPSLGYSAEDIDRLCYRRYWNGQECFSPIVDLGDLGCRGDFTEDRSELEVMTADCSDVEPCAKGRCWIQPFIYDTPDVVSFYYPECSDTLPPPQEAPSSSPAPTDQEALPPSAETTTDQEAPPSPAPITDQDGPIVAAPVSTQGTEEGSSNSIIVEGTSSSTSLFSGGGWHSTQVICMLLISFLTT